MIRTLVSDLGNVLLHFDHRLITKRLVDYWPGIEWTEERESRFWAMLRAFEAGELTTTEFLALAASVMGVHGGLSQEKFLPLWADIFWRNDALLELLSPTREKLTLILLSNTNPLHISWAREQYPEVFGLFHDHVFSCEVGMVKPDPLIYMEALHRADAIAEETLYFDDIAAYVDAAASLGMHAYQYVSVDGVRDVLRMYNLLPPPEGQLPGTQET